MPRQQSLSKRKFTQHYILDLAVSFLPNSNSSDSKSCTKLAQLLLSELFEFGKKGAVSSMSYYFPAVKWRGFPLSLTCGCSLTEMSTVQ